MAAITKKEVRLKLEFVANTDHTIHAGLVAVEAMARRFGLWEKLRQHRCLDPRKDRTRGYGPEVIAGQLIYALGSGGGGLSDSEALNDDPLARELFGVHAGQREVFFDDTQLEVSGKHLSRRARQWVARVLVPGGWLNWWQRWMERAWPQEQSAGRPRLSTASG